MIVNGIIAIAVGYLLGSIPPAYIAVRLMKGKDIRQIGGGNVGGLNVLREVGRGAGIAVMVADIVKGVGAVAVARWLLDVSQPFVLTAGFAAIVGHNWSIFLKFTGGKGMAATIGALAILMPVYGYWQGLLIFLGIVVVGLIITRNVALSTGIALLCLPFIAWLGMKSGLFVIFAVSLGLVIGLKFLPTARASWAKSEGIKDFIRGH
jgi:glycerol-3-phosphate acyltransferase PlsY